ncbi:MAG: alpha/beta hydrolase [Phaeodactylibacter sp.]|uniref:alpha/beta hydrolase n=1 Tax=Phaeodactylibacter sp. TaxID=1940289 RepID=UPI0032EEF2FA
MAELLKAGAVFFVGFLALYLLIVLVVWLGQERMIFQGHVLPQHYAFSFKADFEEYSIPAADGAILNALLFRSDSSSRGVVLYLHGNRGNLSRWGHMHRPFTQRGYDVLLIDYRGYGKSTGKPTESGLYQDGEAALQWLLQYYEARKIIIYGRSLGSGVAAYLAARNPHQLLILETPYDALTNVIQHQALLPLPGCIFRHHFPTYRYLPAAEGPIYILAGSHDRLIPLYLSKRLQPLIGTPENFKVIQGAGHRNLAAFQAYHFELDRLLLP